MKKCLIFLLIVLASCKSKPKQEHPIAQSIIDASYMQLKQEKPYITIDVEKAEVIKDAELRKRIKLQYIPLKTPEPIGEIEKVLIYDNKIYVLDMDGQEAVFIFDMEGNLLKMIKTKGPGPEEYTGVSDMDIDKSKGELLVMDRFSPTMLYYTLDGEFKRKAIRFGGLYFALINNNMLSLMGSMSYGLTVNYHLVVSSKGKALYKAFPYLPLQFDQVSYKRLQYNSDNELLFTPTLSDTVYHITSDSTYSIKYVIKHPKSMWQKWDEYISYDEVEQLERKQNYTSFGRPVYETDNNLIFFIGNGNEYNSWQYYLYEKKTKEIFKIAIPGHIFDKNIMLNAIPFTKGVYKNNYFGWIAEDLLEGIKQIKSDVKKNHGSYKFESKEFGDIVENYDGLGVIVVLYEIE